VPSETTTQRTRSAESSQELDHAQVPSSHDSEAAVAAPSSAAQYPATAPSSGQSSSRVPVHEAVQDAVRQASEDPLSSSSSRCTVSADQAVPSGGTTSTSQLSVVLDPPDPSLAHHRSYA
jgi:hypothetical protein